MSNINVNTLIVFEDDHLGSRTHYTLDNKYLNILELIDHKIFRFLVNGIICDDPNFKMTKNIEQFITKFKNGKNTKKWKSVAKFIKTEYFDNDDVLSIICPIRTYYVYLSH